mmetsp:Transcript_44245/g.134727  ORF Transcript_44245/g.134727 Transcript_44245/m.134727 type:complete len:94 (-) Transcript_44245:164-445(-)
MLIIDAGDNRTVSSVRRNSAARRTTEMRRQFHLAEIIFLLTKVNSHYKLHFLVPSMHMRPDMSKDCGSVYHQPQVTARIDTYSLEPGINATRV